MTEAREWQHVQETKGESHSTPPWQAEHKIIEAECILCNTDVSWTNQLDPVGLGWFFRDLIGRVIEEGARIANYIRSPLMAEATAILEALVTARRLNISKLRLASDSAVIINAINTKKAPPEIYGLIKDILAISSSCSLCFVFTPRVENRVANRLSKAVFQWPLLLCNRSPLLNEVFSSRKKRLQNTRVSKQKNILKSSKISFKLNIRVWMQSLSQGDKKILLRSIAMIMPLYAMSC